MPLEIIADSLETAISAEKLGADRLEVCIKLEVGGVSPSISLVRKILRRIQIPSYIMIRPRGGDFVYSKEEFELMKNEIQLMKELGVKGIVVGILKKNGKVDKKRTAKLVELSRPMEVTFHRAFDEVTDQSKALEDVIQTGCDRILTSGGKESAESGIEEIKELTRMSAGRIIIMAGAGVRSENMVNIIKKTRITEVHSSAKNGKGQLDQEEIKEMVRLLKSLHL